MEKERQILCTPLVQLLRQADAGQHTSPSTWRRKMKVNVMAARKQVIFLLSRSKQQDARTVFMAFFSRASEKIIAT